MASLAVVTASSAILAVVTLASIILTVVTASSASLAVVTLASVILTVVTASSTSIVLTTFSAPIAVTPAFVIVTSPLTATSEDLLLESPTNILPSFNCGVLVKFA